MLRQEGAIPQAIRLLRAAQKRHPGDVWLNHDLAQALFSQPIPQIDEAIRFYTAARAIRPEIGHALAHALITKGDSEEAVSIFAELIRLRPKNPNHRNCLGVLYDDLKQPRRAQALFREALAINPSLGVAWLNLGRSLGKMSDEIGAEKALREACRLLPQSVDGRMMLATSLYNQGRLREAETTLREALALDPRHPEILILFGRLLTTFGKIDDAADVFERAFDLQPRNPDSTSNLAVLRWRQGRFQDAIAVLRRSLAVKPDFALGQLQLGVMLRNVGQPSEALKPLGKAIELTPKNALAVSELAQTLADLGRNADAIRKFREALNLDPNNSIIAYNFGNVLRAVNDDREAIHWYRRAIAIRPDYAEATCNLAHALRDVGEFSEAVILMQRGHELGKSQPDWQYPSALWVLDCEKLQAIEAVLPELLTRRRPFTSIEERLLAIRGCFHKSFHAARVKLIRAALAIDPSLANRPAGIDLTSAARSAMIVSLGKSIDSHLMSPKARANMLDQALTWLVADLQRLRSAMHSDDALTRSAARQRLSGWLDNPAFETLRSPEAVRKLLPRTQDMQADVA